MKAGKILARTTRRAFRKKLVTFGLSTFMCLALTATGFAAWMLSNDANAQADGTIEVAAVSEAGIEIADLTFLDNNKSNFQFEPQENDVTGRVRWDEENSEDMDIRIGWTLENYQNVGDTILTFKIPPTIQKLVDETYITVPLFTKQTATENIGDIDYTVYTYELADITFPEGQNTGSGTMAENLLEYSFTKAGEVVTVEFEFTLKFNWGSKFGGYNPGYYYDDHETGKTVAYDTIRDTLNELKAAAHGITAEKALAKITDTDLKTQLQNATAGVILGHLSKASQEELFNSNQIPKYYFVITAKAA